MVNLKKYNVVLNHFVLFLTFIVVFSCAEQKYFVTKIEGKEIAITNKNIEISSINSYIEPYRERINRELNAPISYVKQTLDKSGKWQTTIGNLLADITLKKGDSVFYSRENKKIDLCLLNNGGIRAIIPKGNITIKTAYEVMPFENTSIVVALKGEQILEMVNHIITEKKPQPISGINFTIDKNNQPKNIFIQGKPFENTNTYYVITSDYLSNGGDKMDFFKKATATYDIDYKLRNIMIDYFKTTDTISIPRDQRILIE